MCDAPQKAGLYETGVRVNCLGADTGVLRVYGIHKSR